MTTLIDTAIFNESRIIECLILLLISTPIYFFWRWVFNKYINDKLTRIISVWVSTIITMVGIYLGLIALLLYYITREPSSDFEQSEWLANKEERFSMGDDIVESKILVGKDTNQVKQLLGQPSWKDSLNTSWTYDMGTGGSGLGFMFHHLSVKFDNAKVVKAEHIRMEE